MQYHTQLEIAYNVIKAVFESENKKMINGPVVEVNLMGNLNVPE